MTLGEKLRDARKAAGLTQRQLCEDIVTRNMLSQIENGTARPSMKTLERFAGRLGKSLSYFLEETAVLSGNTQVMEQVRRDYDAGDYTGALQTLKVYRGPDEVYDREKSLVLALCLLELARQAIGEGKYAYARELLSRQWEQTHYCAGALNRKRLLLLGRLGQEKVSHLLPVLDEELQLRAQEAMEAGRAARAAALLDACENQTDGKWLLLRGSCHLEEKAYEQAKDCLLAAESQGQLQAVVLLESCFREQGDYKMAYEYACKQK